MVTTSLLPSLGLNHNGNSVKMKIFRGACGTKNKIEEKMNNIKYGKNSASGDTLHPKVGNNNGQLRIGKTPCKQGYAVVIDHGLVMNFKHIDFVKQF